VQITPTPTADGQAIDHYTLQFSEPVYGLSLSALSLDRDGGANLLNGAQTLSTSDNITWTLGNLAGITSAPGNYQLAISAAVTDTAGNPVAPNPQWASVVGRYAFYNNSTFDGNDPATNAQDDGAIAQNPDGSPKAALRPGQPASFANYTSYTKGINGIMIDLAGRPDSSTLSAADFVFSVGNSATPSTWAPAPAPQHILIRPGKGIDGSDRIEITFADRAIINEWLRVTVLADGNTGLARPDVFYFGNMIGEDGADPANAVVNVADVLAARGRLSIDPVGPSSPYDYNRDGLIDLADMLAARANQAPGLQLIDAPAVAPLPALTAVTPGPADSSFVLATARIASPDVGSLPASPISPLPAERLAAASTKSKKLTEVVLVRTSPSPARRKKISMLLQSAVTRIPSRSA